MFTIILLLGIRRPCAAQIFLSVLCRSISNAKCSVETVFFYRQLLNFAHFEVRTIRSYTPKEVFLSFLEDPLSLLLLEQSQKLCRCHLHVVSGVETDSPCTVLHTRKEKEVTGRKLKTLRWVVYQFHPTPNHPGCYQHRFVARSTVLMEPQVATIHFFCLSSLTLPRASLTS